MFSIVTKLVAAVLAVAALAQVRPPLRILPSSASGNLLRISDLSCDGIFLTPYIATGSYASGIPIALKEYDGSKRVYLAYDGTGNLVEFNEPTLSACNTALESVNVGTNPGWGGNWGPFSVNAQDNFVPGSNATYALGLHRDTVSGRVYMFWAASYSGVPAHNTFAARTLNEGDHTTSLVGCWGIPAYPPRWMGSGMLEIPSSFVSAHLPAGRRIAAGMGGFVGSNENSFGPALAAIEQPTSNACSSGTDYEIAASTLLESHQNNEFGPHCMSSSNNGPGCTPALAPTAPYPAKTSFTGYSMDMYGWTWEPYGGTGWWTFEMAPRMLWYDDGVKQGVYVPFTMPSGWLNTDVSSETTPTFNVSTGIGTFTAGSVDMHDGSNLNVGDGFWVESCSPVFDGSNCEIANGRRLTIAKVTAINTATRLVTYQMLSPDFGTGATGYKPLLGGDVWAGCVYAHGGPGCSRYTIRHQIYDPAQYAEVIASTRQPYDVQYVEEADATTIFDRYGSPASGGGVRGSIVAPGETRSISSVIADTDRHKIIVFFSGALALPGVTQSLGYVLNVSQAPPMPQPVPPAQASFPLLPAAAAVWALGRLRDRRAA